jgi:hypothetical protein
MAKNDELLDKFNEDFVTELFWSALKFKNIMAILCETIAEGFFPEESQKKFFTEIKTQFKIEGKMPTIGGLKLVFRKDRQMMFYIDTIREFDGEFVTEDSIVNSIEKFVRQSKFMALFNNVSDEYSKGKKKQAFNNFIKGAEELANFTLTEGVFENVFENFYNRHAVRIVERDSGKMDKLKFGIDELDYKSGGMERGDLVCLLAQAKGGKSFALTHVGLHTSRMGGGVLHFQLEGTKKQCMNRYDSAWTGTKYSEIKEANITEEKFNQINKYLKNHMGEVSVYAPEQFNVFTMVEVKRQVAEIKKKRQIDLVIIDYLDLLNPDSHVYSPKDERFRQQKTAQMMKQLAMEENVVVLTATQASNIPYELSNSPEFVITRDYLAEDKGKVRPVDMLISINRTKFEEKNGICRLYAEAMRESGSWGNEPIYIRQSLAYSKFYNRKKTMDNPVTLEEYDIENDEDREKPKNKKVNQNVK